MSFPDNDYMPRTGRATSPTGAFPISGPPAGWSQQYGQHPYPPMHHTPKPPKKRRSVLAIVLWCVLGALVLVVGIGVVAVLVSSTAGTTSGSATGAPRAAAPAVETTAAKTFPTPKLADFVLAVKTTKKQCFGSAGCNVEFQIDLDYRGPALEPNSSWDVTFDLNGSQDSYTSTLHMTVGSDGLNGTFEQDSDQMVQTKSSKAVLKPVVTSVTAA